MTRSISLAVLALPVLALAAEPPKAEEKRVSRAVARDRAAVMHELHAETLGVVHHRYFRRESFDSPRVSVAIAPFAAA